MRYSSRKVKFTAYNLPCGDVVIDFKIIPRKPTIYGMMSVCWTEKEYLEDIKEILRDSPVRGCFIKWLKKNYDSIKVLEQSV